MLIERGKPVIVSCGVVEFTMQGGDKYLSLLTEYSIKVTIDGNELKIGWERIYELEWILGEYVVVGFVRDILSGAVVCDLDLKNEILQAYKTSFLINKHLIDNVLILKIEE